MSNGDQEARDESIAEFWQLFAANRRIIESSEPDDEIREQLLESLQVIDPGLFYEICTDPGELDFVITSGGDAGLFDLVEQIVAAAPSVGDWKLTALKPPGGFDFQTAYEGLIFDPAEMWFLPLESGSNPDAFGIHVGIPGFDEARREEFKVGVLIVLDTALGERSAIEDIELVDCTALPAGCAEQAYIELPDLARYIAWRKRREP